MTTLGRRGVFDRMAQWAAVVTSRAPFFAVCVVLVAAWLAEGAVRVASNGWGAFMDNAYQLQINSSTTTITFLLVALWQNSEARADAASQHKLDQIAYGLRDLMDHVNHVMPCEVSGCEFADDIRKLERAIGIEEEVGTK